jgi:hypothetical protein
MAEDAKTQALRTLVESAEPGTTVTLPEGEFVLERALKITLGVTVVGAEGTVASKRTQLLSAFGPGPFIVVRKPGEVPLTARPTQ